MRVLAAVFFYNPDVERAISNIERYVDCVSKLIVWNNTPNSDVDAYKNAFKGKPYEHKLIFAGGVGNQGMSKPINFAVRMAIEKDYDCLLTMDQDSVWQNFEYYVQQIENSDYLHNAFEPSINNVKNESVEVENMEFDRIISSGMVYGRECLKSVGYMNEDFFVEGIDTEYGYRILVNKDTRLYRINHAMLKQNVGERDKSNMAVLPLWIQFLCNLFNKNLVPNKYNATRLREIAYSTTVMTREFPGYIGNTEKEVLSASRVIKHLIIPILLYKLTTGGVN